MSIRTLLLTALAVSGLATASPDGGPPRSTADAGTRGTTVPDRPAPVPEGATLPAPRTQSNTTLGTGSETLPPPPSTPPVRQTPAPTPTPTPDVPPTTQPPRPTPH